MDALECLFTRRTAPALSGPEPTREQLTTLLRAAVAAPDHKLIRPWKFVVVRGAAREKLGQAYAEALRAQNPAIDADTVAKQQKKPLRAPVTIAVIGSPKEVKVPRWEQLASAAAAAENLCLAAHALGLGSGWKSTSLGGHPAVQQLLGMAPTDELLGLVELGQVDPNVHPKPRPHVELSSVVSELEGDALVPFAPADTERAR